MFSLSILCHLAIDVISDEHQMWWRGTLLWWKETIHVLQCFYFLFFRSILDWSHIYPTPHWFCCLQVLSFTVLYWQWQNNIRGGNSLPDPTQLDLAIWASGGCFYFLGLFFCFCFNKNEGTCWASMLRSCFKKICFKNICFFGKNIYIYLSF